jgi:hypothetical protein
MRNELLGKLSPFKNNIVKVNEYQQTNDIINELLKGHKKYAGEYDKIAPKFWKGNLKSSCNYIWSYLKNNVRYKIEPDTRQSIKSPAAIFATAHGDCKHYSSVFGGILDAWKRSGKNVNWCYRFANYKLFGNQPHHVFVVVNPNTKNEIWCDSVLEKFDWHKPYVNKIDKKINTQNMALYQISGIGCKDCGGTCGEGYYGMPQISGRKERRAARRSGENCKGRAGAKIALAPARNAFLLLVKFNVKGFARKLQAALNDNRKLKLLEKWCGLGGSADKLKAAVAKGAKKRYLGFIGLDPVTITTALASAAAIIALLKPFLGERGKEIAEGVESAVEQGKEIAEGSGGGETTSGTSNYLIYGGLAIGALYLFTRKKHR